MDNIAVEIAKKLNDKIIFKLAKRGIKGPASDMLAQCISGAIAEVLTDEFDFALKEKSEIVEG